MRSLLEKHRVLVALVLAAFALRFAYDVFVHPPLAHRYSDMRTYLTLARALERAPWTEVDPRATFFPWGTHVLVYVTRVVLGGSNVAISFVLAALGAGVVGYWTATAARLLAAHRWAWIAIGVCATVHVPLVLLGGFVLSEVPFAFFLAAAAFHALRWLDDAKGHDVVVAGVALAVACAFRPQAGLSLVALVALFAWRRGALPRSPGKAIALALAPLLVVSAISAARIRHHTGHQGSDERPEWGWISTNGAYNLAIGRCHARSLRAERDDTSFEPPALDRLSSFEAKRGVKPIFDLDPVRGPELSVDAHLWQQAPYRRLAFDCARESGVLRQAKFSATHLLLLWAYNLPWPTGGLLTEIAQLLQALAIPGLLVALWRARRRENAREATIAAQVLGLFATAAIFFGEARLRVPYDGFIWMLAMTVYAPLATRLAVRLRARSTVKG